jgi:DNA-binding HxlR family transcriptional regulator
MASTPWIGHMSAMARQGRKTAFDSIYQAADLLGDAWSWLILREAIFDNVTRFSDFQLRLGVSRRVLSNRLDTLTEGGLFERRSAREEGGHLLYVLTPMGRDFLSCLMTAMHWGERWFPDLKETDGHAVHRRYGHRLRAVLRCSECSQLIKAREVAVAAIHRASADLIGAKRQRTPNLDALEHAQPSAIVRTLRVIGDRWSSLIIRECFLGTRRFGSFEEHLGIAPNILTHRLERLVAFGVLMKKPSPSQAGWLEYRLTEQGLDLYSVPLSMLKWAENWLAKGTLRTDLRHKVCGKRFSPLLTCSTCAEPIGIDDIAIQYSSSATGPKTPVATAS